MRSAFRDLLTPIGIIEQPDKGSESVGMAYSSLVSEVPERVVIAEDQIDVDTYRRDALASVHIASRTRIGERSNCLDSRRIRRPGILSAHRSALVTSLTVPPMTALAASG